MNTQMAILPFVAAPNTSTTTRQRIVVDHQRAILVKFHENWLSVIVEVF